MLFRERSHTWRCFQWQLLHDDIEQCWSVEIFVPAALFTICGVILGIQICCDMLFRNVFRPRLPTLYWWFQEGIQRYRTPCHSKITYGVLSCDRIFATATALPLTSGLRGCALWLQGHLVEIKSQFDQFKMCRMVDSCRLRMQFITSVAFPLF